MLSVVNVFKRTNTQKLPLGLKYFHLLILQTNMKNEKKHEKPTGKIHHHVSTGRTVDN